MENVKTIRLDFMESKDNEFEIHHIDIPIQNIAYIKYKKIGNVMLDEEKIYPVMKFHVVLISRHEFTFYSNNTEFIDNSVYYTLEEFKRYIKKKGFTYIEETFRL